MRNVIFLIFSTIMITGLGLSLGLEHAVLEPIPDTEMVYPSTDGHPSWY